MSPIPSLTAFVLDATPSAADTAAGQSAPVASQHVLTTGGLLFVAVGVVTLAGYFYHGRRARTKNGWAAGLSVFLSSLRPRGSVGTSNGAPTNLPIPPTMAFEHHVNMVYARHFHPTHWNLVEAYSATPSTPAIFVEDEATEIPVSEPKPFGMTSFLSMDDDDDAGNDSVCEKPNRVGRPRVKALAPYDTRSSVNINFRNDVIGSTVRTGAFLTIPGVVDDNPDDASDGSSSFESLLDLYSSGCEETLVIPPASSCTLQRFGETEISMPSLGSRCRHDDTLPSSTSSSKHADCRSEGTDAATRSGALPSIPEELEEDLAESSSFSSDHFAYDRISTVLGPSGGTEQHGEASFDFEMDSCHGAACDGIVTTSSRTAASIQQHDGTSTNRDWNFLSTAHDDILMWPQGSRSQVEELLPHETGLRAKIDSSRDIVGDPGILPSISEEIQGLHADSSFGSQLDYYFSAYDATTAPGSPPATRSRRHGMADMTDIAESLKDSISEDVHKLGFAISSPTGLLRPSEFVETDSAVPCSSPDILQRTGDGRIRDISGRDNFDDSVHNGSCELETSEVRDECLDLMRRLLEELRDPSMDCSARSLSEDSESTYSVDDENDEVVPRLTPTLGLNIRRNSVVSASSTSRAETESSEEAPTYPFTPPPKSAAFLTRSPDDPKARIRSSFTEDVQVVSPTSLSSPPASPPHPFFRTHRNSLFLYGPHSPTEDLPRF